MLIKTKIIFIMIFIYNVMWRRDVMPWRHLTSRRHAMTSHHVMTSHHRPVLSISWPKSEKTREITSLTLVTLTLTIVLVQDIIKINPYTKYRDDISNG